MGVEARFAVFFFHFRDALVPVAELHRMVLSSAHCPLHTYAIAVLY